MRTKIFLIVVLFVASSYAQVSEDKLTGVLSFDSQISIQKTNNYFEQ